MERKSDLPGKQSCQLSGYSLPALEENVLVTDEDGTMEPSFIKSGKEAEAQKAKSTYHQPSPMLPSLPVGRKNSRILELRFKHRE